MLRLICPMCDEKLIEYNNICEYYKCECGFTYEKKGFK